MSRGKKFALGFGLAAIALAIAAWLAAAWWLPSDEETAARLAAEAGERLGVPVTIGSAHWALLPRPVLVVNDFRTQQAEPITIGQFVAHPKLLPLLTRKLALDRIVIRDAVFPRNSVRAFRGRFDAKSGDKSGKGGRASLDRFEFSNVTWVYYGGIRVAYDGEIDFDADWRPRRAVLRRPGADTPFTMSVDRDGGADRWQVRTEVGGGTLNGDAALESGTDGVMRLSGKLAPRGIEASSAMQTFNRRSPVGGKVAGSTTLSAEGATVGELVRSLHTRTDFSVSEATILRFDLDKAIDTLGKEHKGQTKLDELTGRLDTQNTDDGMRASYTGLQARSGKYSANGEATVYRRRVEARGVLYMDEGKGEVPFTVNGPVAKPKTTVAPAKLAAAAVRKKAGDIGDRIRETFRKVFTAEE